MSLNIPPGQKVVDNLPVLHYSSVPVININQWSLTVDGLVRNSLKFSMEDILKIKSVEILAPFHCVTGWSNMEVKWKGVLFKDIVDIVQPFDSAKYVFVTCYDNYTTNLPLDVVLQTDVILAYGLWDKELPPQHGYPLRLVVPKRYAYKSAKWVKEIKFIEKDKMGFWESRGYSNSADPFKEERYASN